MDDTVSEIHRSGHRAFVGGQGDAWDSIADLQFDFLRSRGLQPHQAFLDVGCGALRGGSRLIPYLDAGKYHGIDKFIDLIIYGVCEEIGADTFRAKAPKFVVGDSFEFERFNDRFMFALAQSLFTHLAPADIEQCLRKLAPCMPPYGRFFATFFEGSSWKRNPAASHSHAGFTYSRGQMEKFGSGAGWEPRYIGAWGHPRGQHIIEYVRQS